MTKREALIQAYILGRDWALEGKGPDGMIDGETAHALAKVVGVTVTVGTILRGWSDYTGR